MMQITPKTPPSEISEYIIKLREQKGKEKEVLAIIDRAFQFGNDFVVNLFWEEALTYQHLVMIEDAKGERQNKKLREQNLMRMDAVIMDAKYYVVRFHLDRWKHRLYRFLGRISDYKKEYKRSVSYYKKSLKYVKNDPEYMEKKYPRWLEIEAFVSFSLIMSGQEQRGYEMAKRIFDRFDTDNEAKLLKRRDYSTWAIWRTGIPIRTIRAFIDKNFKFDNKELLVWLNAAEELLHPAKPVKIWADFRYRKDEILALRKMLKEN